jgi:type IV pilus assembly protein PilB
VLSTLHTNDAAGAVARMLDIGVAPYNLAAALRLVTAQRLVRRLCPACRTPAPESPSALRAAGVAESAPGAFTPYRAQGCDACHGIGYRGRIGVHQVMPIGTALRDLIVARASALALAAQAEVDGVRTLRHAALARVRDGTTSLAEATSATEAA